MSPTPLPRWATMEKPQNLWKTMFRLYRYIGKYRLHIYAGILLSFVSSVLVLIAPQYLNEIVDIISASVGTSVPMDVERILGIVWILVVLYSVAALFRAASGYIIPSASEFNGNVMRIDLNKKITRLPLKIIDGMNIGDIMSRFTNDTDNIRNQSAECISHTIVAFTMIIGSFMMMCIMEWHLALIAIAPTVVGLVIIFTVINRSQPLFKDLSVDTGAINGLVEETYYGLDAVNQYNGRQRARDRFRDVNDRLFRITCITRTISSSMPNIIGFISNLSYVFVCIAGSMMIIDGKIGFGVVVAFFIYVKHFTEPMGRLSNSLASMQTVSASSERVFEFLDQPEMPSEDGCRQPPERASGSVVFENVCFSYNPGREVIHNLNLEIMPGQKIAIVGPTGSGKTTIANLLMRFYELDSGRILVDGIDIRELRKEDVHRIFCMILQDSWMFEGSIRQNLTFGEDIDDETLLSACESVGMERYIESLPDRLDTVIDDAMSISVGQRQQINIARAIIRDSPIVILDEATSAVDPFTERKIQKAMNEIMESHTSFVIAHRLSTIEDADMILVIKDGSIIEKGKHEELLAKGGFYRQLYDSQFESCE